MFRIVMMFKSALILFIMPFVAPRPTESICSRLLTIYEDMPTSLAILTEEVCMEKPGKCKLMSKFLVEGSRSMISSLRKMERCNGESEGSNEISVADICTAIQAMPSESTKYMKAIFSMDKTQSLSSQLAAAAAKEFEYQLRPVFYQLECEDQ